MKKILIVLLAILQVGCSTKKILLKNVLSKDVICVESESNLDVSLFFNKKDIIEIFPKLLSENFNDQSRTEDSTFFIHLKNARQDTLVFSKYQGITLDLCIYNLLIDGKVKILDKANNSFVSTIYTKKTKSKLGQLNQNFYHLKPIKKNRFFFSFLLAYGE